MEDVNADWGFSGWVGCFEEIDDCGHVSRSVDAYEGTEFRVGFGSLDCAAFVWGELTGWFVNGGDDWGYDSSHYYGNYYHYCK